MSQQTLPEEAIDEHELEDFIQDWHWDENSLRFAKALGTYLFQFINSLTAQELSAKTINKHCDNCWCIGWLECGYGYRDIFTPGEVFASSYADYEYEFQRKVSNSAYAIKAYRTTWRKLYKYTKALGHLQER